MLKHLLVTTISIVPYYRLENNFPTLSMFRGTLYWP